MKMDDMKNEAIKKAVYKLVLNSLLNDTSNSSVFFKNTTFSSLFRYELSNNVKDRVNSSIIHNYLITFY